MIMFEFHVRKDARNKYKLDENLFTITGDLIISNFRLARILADKINSKRKAEKKFDRLTSAGQLNALGLIHEIFHYIIRIYEEQENPGVFSREVDFLKSQIGENNLDEICLEFIKDFPPLDVYAGKKSPDDYLNGSTGNKSNREIILEELLLLHLENINSAAKNLDELYADEKLTAKTKYKSLLNESEKFFAKEKPFRSENISLISFLKNPITTNPHSLEEQLDFILRKWRVYIFDKFGNRILQSKDLILEELKLYLQFGGGKPTPPVPFYDAEYLRMLRAKLARGETLTDEERRFYYSEYEKFTEDIDWMPKVVMIAKNAFVWLDQLSKKYGRAITTLDQIPDEELDTIARWNFTALWLIGIWERSSASRKIKQLTGNPEAASSAYSLFDYVIANELGGEDAFQNLKARAWQRGIRLASDMVPNHTGIFSKWIVEKPDYFIQSNYSPYPGYTFYGQNLSDDSRVEVRIEDKYYTREDAAVVFQRRDSFTGNVKYIYHGNDGTHMPWNDTAQLNLLKPEVREALIQTIMHVARKFPIIRFDAAMTLTKKHYQRLWFPQPGTGGAIPSRSDYSLTREAFDAAMPNEFWREVVDRINSKMPHTLLLAEAFWLMEGYFVRTLGMHRVYNSAFMHMLMKEENNKYRDLIKNTLDFNPEILKRYVNFMSNPDEETAVNQFGKGDKYFGVAVMMVTLPGLPMFAHGQIEGFSEKYGMEYKRAYYNEFQDDYLIRRHEAEIFPLIQKRYLFSQVSNFEFYDFINEFGSVNDNVFAYSNKSGTERALVIYNNTYERSRGTINYSVKKIDSSSKYHKVQKLAEALGLNYNFKIFYSFKEHKTKLEYLISSREIFENGLTVSLEGFEYKLFIDFREIFDEDGSYENLNNNLRGTGVPSIEAAHKELKLAPLNESLIDLLNPNSIDELKRFCISKESQTSKGKNDFLNPLSQPLLGKLNKFIHEVNRSESIGLDSKKIIENIDRVLKDIKFFFGSFAKWEKEKANSKLISQIKKETGLKNILPINENSVLLFAYLIINETFDLVKDKSKINLFSELLLNKALFEILKSSGTKVDEIYEGITLIKALLTKDKLIIDAKISPLALVIDLIKDKEACEYVLLNEFEGKIYFNKERFEKLLFWIIYLRLISTTERFGKKGQAESKTKKKAEKALTENFLSNDITNSFKLFDKIRTAAENSGYQLIEVKNILAGSTKTGKKGSVRKSKNKTKATKLTRKKN